MRRRLLQGWRDREVKGDMCEFWQLKGARVGGTLSLGRQRGIFRFNPVKKRATLGRVGRDQTDSRWWWQEGDRGRINHLKEIEAERMERRRGEKETGDRRPPFPGRFPVKEEVAVRLRVSRWAHRCIVVASATDLIPCSSAAFVTAITRS